MPRGLLMALPLTLLAGMLSFSGVQASDKVDGSRNYGFLSKYMPLRSESSTSSIGKSFVKPGCLNLIFLVL